MYHKNDILYISYKIKRLGMFYRHRSKRKSVFVRILSGGKQSGCHSPTAEIYYSRKHNLQWNNGNDTLIYFAQSISLNFWFSSRQYIFMRIVDLKLLSTKENIINTCNSGGWSQLLRCSWQRMKVIYKSYKSC